MDGFIFKDVNMLEILLNDEIVKKTLINLLYSSKMAFKHGCIVFDKYNNIISKGYNIQPSYYKWDQSIHAEVYAINQILRDKKLVKDIHKYKILVVRLSNIVKYEDKIIVSYGNSKPCINCHNYLLKVGIKDSNICYSLPKE